MAFLAMAAGTSQVALAQATCRAQSGASPPQVVELYTSEGCNSCPPADRWLSSLVQRGDVIAAAFHVDYWDRLGWRDRFASARFTERQAQAQAYSGVRYSYTPQVLVDGRDWRRWPDLPAAARSSLVNLSLQRSGGAGDVACRAAARRTRDAGAVVGRAGRRAQQRVQGGRKRRRDAAA